MKTREKIKATLYTAKTEPNKRREMSPKTPNDSKNYWFSNPSNISKEVEYASFRLSLLPLRPTSSPPPEPKTKSRKTAKIVAMPAPNQRSAEYSVTRIRGRQPNTRWMMERITWLALFFLPLDFYGGYTWLQPLYPPGQTVSPK